MNLTNLEKETVVLFNEAEGAARIETFDRRLRRQLRNVSTYEGVSCEEDQRDYGVFTIPKSMIKVHAPPKRKKLTEEQKQIATEQLELARAQRRKISFEC